MIDKLPKFRYAVFSRAPGKVAELESSFAEKWQAEQLFKNQYSKWGMPETVFYLIDWETQELMQKFDPKEADHVVRSAR